MRRPRRPAQDLRFTIDCLPHRTRVAMLEGVEGTPIIVGAYTDRDGVCPMLAAHRRGGRTGLVSFARAWDRYTRAGKRSRKATDREVRTLKTMLQASLLNDESARGELAEAVAELKAIKARRAAEAEEAATPSRAAGAEEAATPIRGAEGEEAAERSRGAEPVASRVAATGAEDGRARRDTTERDRSDELRRRPGWAWLGIFRRYDEYEAALDRLERAEREVERREMEQV